MRVLLITNHLPYPPNRGTPIRNYNLLKRLAVEHEVWVVAFADAEEEQEGKTQLLKFCQGVETVVSEETGVFARPLDAVKYILRGQPFELRHFHSYELIEKIQQLISEVDFDVIDIVDSHMALYLEELPLDLQQRTVVTFIDVIFDKFKLISRLEPKLRRKIRMWLYSRTMRIWEPYYVGRFARCITVSPSDRTLLLSVNPRLKIDVAPNGIDTKQFQILPPTDGKLAMTFVGNMAYEPNLDGMLYFCDEILPLIRAELPDIELWITGIDPPQEIYDLASKHIHVTGAVDDVRPYYERGTVSIVPLRAGGGTRLKILESMALGRPVISTSIGCEGIDVVDGEHLFIADSPEAFAEKTLRLIGDDDLRKRMIKQGRHLAETRYDWDVITKQLLQTYTEVASEQKR